MCSCYSHQKATVRFGKAVSTFPDIGANYCAVTFPSVSELIKGDSVITFDTLYVGPDVVFDTITVNDTVVVERRIRGITKYITKLVTITDTLKTPDKAAITACQMAKDAALRLLEKLNTESDKWKRIARIRLWIIISLGAVLGAGIYFRRFLK